MVLGDEPSASDAGLEDIDIARRVTHAGYEIHSVQCVVPVKVDMRVTGHLDSERFELRVDGMWVTVRAREALNGADPDVTFAIPLSNVAFIRR